MSNEHVPVLRLTLLGVGAMNSPEWAAEVDLMFADAAGWRRPIRFAGGVGGHACVAETAEQAHRHGVRRLVFAHIG
jgi:hypothetical protein